MNLYFYHSLWITSLETCVEKVLFLPPSSGRGLANLLEYWIYCMRCWQWVTVESEADIIDYCADSYFLCYACICGPKHFFGLCIILACISVKN